jgi:hypothetical protein
MIPGIPGFNNVEKYINFLTKQSSSSQTTLQRQKESSTPLLSSLTKDKDDTEETTWNHTSQKYSSSSESIEANSDELLSSSDKAGKVEDSDNSNEKLRTRGKESSGKKVSGKDNTENSLTKESEVQKKDVRGNLKEQDTIVSQGVSSEEGISELREKIITEKKLRIRFLPDLIWKRKQKVDVVFVFGFSQLGALSEDVDLILRNYFESLTQDKMNYRLGFVRFTDSIGHRFEFSELTKNWLVFKGRLTSSTEKQQSTEKGMSPLGLLMTTIEKFQFRKDAMRRLVFFSKVKFDSNSSIERSDSFVPNVDELISVCIRKNITVDVCAPDDDNARKLASQTDGNYIFWSDIAKERN